MSSLQQIQSKFERIGARASIQQMTRESFRQHGLPFAIDIAQQAGGELFEIESAESVTLTVPDIRSRDRHLLLRAENWLGRIDLLCGHDEMHWFVAALPEAEDIRSVADAKEALKPESVKRKERPRSNKRRRKGDVYLRQGEWFFLPCPHAGIEQNSILRDASLIRGPGSTAHICESMYLDGEREYACDRYPKLAFFESEYRRLLKTRRKAKQWNWRALPFDPTVYVKGWIRHPDHNPMHLDVWHRVEMNTEQQNALGNFRQRIARVKYLD